MLARRSLGKAATACVALVPASSNSLRSAPSCTSMSSPSAMISSTQISARRHYVGQALLSNLSVHCAQVSSCTSLSTLLYSPLGTLMYIMLAYNVVVICTKHVNYSMEITAKDYVQDQQLYVIMRYGILSCILLGMEVMFVEV